MLHLIISFHFNNFYTLCLEAVKLTMLYLNFFTMKKNLCLFLLQVVIFSNSFCQKTKTAVTENKNIDGHPAWIMQGNIYEVNVRQYTPEGTFKAFAKHLDRLKKMGVQTIWFMPINPISKVDRKGSLGSYYSTGVCSEIKSGTYNLFMNYVGT